MNLYRTRKPVVIEDYPKYSARSFWRRLWLSLLLIATVSLLLGYLSYKTL